MRKYGYNWLLVFCAFFLMLSLPHCWSNYIEQCFKPPSYSHEVARWMFSAFDYPLGGTLSVFLLRRMFVKSKEKALRTPEGAGPQVTENTASVSTPQKPLLLRPVLISAYGLVSAVVGSVSLAAHLLTGHVSVGQVGAFTVFLPLCCVAGGYLLTKVKVAQGVPVSTEAQNAAVAPVVPSASWQTAQEPDVVVVGQGQ